VVPTGIEREFPLVPGPLPGQTDLVVGPARTFYNDIYGLTCSPLLDDERVLGWVNRLHLTGNRVFVEPCVEHLDSTGESFWAVGDAWFEATLEGADGHRQLRLRRIAFETWDSYYNSAVPCGSLVAWWALGRTPDGVGAEIQAQVGSFATGELLGRATLGGARLDTDNPGALAAPVWDAACTSARFDGTRYDLESAEIEVRR
jgi:hypothetical protein